METREFHFSEGTSNKFWKISLDGTGFTVHWGKLGTAGQAQTKEFADAAAARQAAEKLIQEKVRKGYLEQGEAAPISVTPTVKAAPAPKAKAAPAEKPAPAAKDEDAPATAPVPAPATPQEEPAPFVFDADQPRSLNLNDSDWAWVSYRQKEPVRPEPPAFDVKEAAARLSKVPNSQTNYRPIWERANIAPVLSKEEALFWWNALSKCRWDKQPKAMAKELLEKKLDRRPELKIALERVCSSFSPESAKPLGSLYSASELFEAMLNLHEEGVAKTTHHWQGAHLADVAFGLCMYVLPYVDAAEREKIRELARPNVTLANWPQSQTGSVTNLPDPSFYVAGAVGLAEELRAVVEALPDDAFNAVEEYLDYYLHPQQVVLGLGSRELVEHHFRRLKLKILDPVVIRAWLAHTGHEALDLVKESLITVTNKEDAEQLLTALSAVAAPEAAPVMLELMLGSKAPKLARKWLDDHPNHTVTGLIPVAAGRGKLADAAVEYLRSLKRKGGQELIAAALDRAPSEAAERVRSLVLEHEDAGGEPLDDASTPDWLKAVLKEAAKKKAPAWVTPADLPAIALDGGRLNEEQTATALAALAASKLEEPNPLVTALKQHADRLSLDGFAWRLFERWLSEGGPAKEKWAMQAIGHWGSDATALKLTPMIRNWPGESQHQRAVLGLECLRTIGTDTALMQINGIAQKVAFKGLKAKAGECMEGIATDRGLTRSQLEDRIVPDCDLDERGSRTFDFGPRQFTMVLGAGMKPMIREADGKIKPDLPKPSAKDDPTLSAQAVADWKLLKKLVAEVAKVQAVRLEQAMVTGRRWPADEFESLLVRHPLMTNLVRMVIWSAYSPEGEREGTFRVTEDLSYADPTDDVFALGPDRTVGIVHPLQLSEKEKAAWGEILSDYEIVPPFSQIGRPVYGLEAGEHEEKELKRWEKIEIPPQSLVFTLEKLGWQRGIPEDGGVFYTHSKPFYGADVSAIVEYEQGVPVGYMEGWDDQNITKCFIIPGIYKPDWYAQHEKQIPLGDVDPVVISEVLNDLNVVASKGK